MKMSKDIVNALNIISDWLAVDDFTESQEIEADLLIIAGHAVYGPKGAGFIGHVDIPDAVLEAWDYLKVHKETREITR
ncbi:hypothetical protein WCT79_00455 [Pectobacterium carotovorum]|uniref:hypothetical protein n=1 Tax=Pectobacterium carotovorum TaxID=554 RepID=UPI0030166298